MTCSRLETGESYGSRGPNDLTQGYLGAVVAIRCQDQFVPQLLEKLHHWEGHEALRYPVG